MSGPPNSNDGLFAVPCMGRRLKVLAGDGAGWDHVSVSLPDRPPTWEEMVAMKRLFFKDDEVVMQLHPAEKDYVNCHPNCLHLWRPQTEEEAAEVKRQWEAAGEEYLAGELAGPIPLPPLELV
jgi:hypothetical protein